MSLTVAARKQALRLALDPKRAAFGPENALEQSAGLCRHLRAQPLWQQAHRVAAFHPMAGEPDLRPVLEEALAAGKRLALPRYEPAQRGYTFRLVGALSELRPGHFGILEPPPEAPRAELIRLDFWLVPGVAFDRGGRRLGRGKGYYDRLLAGVRAHKCGVAFDWQIVERVPAEPHDVCVDSLLTPTRWCFCQADRSGL